MHRRPLCSQAAGCGCDPSLCLGGWCHFVPLASCRAFPVWREDHDFMTLSPAWGSAGLCTALGGVYVCVRAGGGRGRGRASMEAEPWPSMPAAVPP